MAGRKPSDRRKGGAEEVAGEPDLIPIMNLTFVLIAGVLAMTTASIGLISIQAPQLNSGGGAGKKADDPDKKKLNLTIFIKGDGFNLAASGATLDGSSEGREGQALFPRGKDGAYDFAKLQKKLIEIKKVFKDEQAVIIVADPDVEYADVVKVMDTARNYPDNDKPLFPAVAFSAGIVG